MHVVSSARPAVDIVIGPTWHECGWGVRELNVAASQFVVALPAAATASDGTHPVA